VSLLHLSGKSTSGLTTTPQASPAELMEINKSFVDALNVRDRACSTRMLPGMKATSSTPFRSEIASGDCRLYTRISLRRLWPSRERRRAGDNMTPMPLVGAGGSTHIGAQSESFQQPAAARSTSMDI